nr:MULTISPECIES: DEAD/DEAH box helicase family protein [unclassified Exiguobacterium]
MELKFPLINKFVLKEETLFEQESFYDIPSYITENLKHNLRYYQKSALRYFHYSQSSEEDENKNHVLFNMATGSGKTDLMAALILYLFKERNYHNFLFTVNTNSVLEKTIKNLVDKNSGKYLYSQRILIEENQINFKKVEKFPLKPEENTIYIKFSTVQKIADDLFVIKENKMGIIDYEKHPVVILADEAHHYSANTKKEKNDENTWETAINRVLNARRDEDLGNILLEFTATVDFEKESIYNKYKEKVLYRYPLSKLMFDKYSKQVRRIETSAEDTEKMLNAVLLSQYRKYTAYDLGITNFKPIILFKSSKVAVSHDSNKIFNQLIEDLTPLNLMEFVKKQILRESGEDTALKLSYEYYLKNEEKISNIIRDIKRDFDKRNVINANDASGNMLEKGQFEMLNSLENPNNLYRVVFAVAKLTEGWDVLNLYDIVRIEKEAPTNKNATMVEAQLIGRGARYYPFSLEDQKSYKRRFDDDFSHYSLILETLHYHTMNEPQYLKQLIKSLKEIDLPTGKELKNHLIEINVKPSFKNTEIFKKGKIYYNSTIEVKEEYFDSLSKYGINHKIEIERTLNLTSNESGYLETKSTTEFKSIFIRKFNVRYIKKAMRKIEFYKFSNLKLFVPNIKSLNEFIYSNRWLNADNLKLILRVPNNFADSDVAPNDILKVTLEFLKEYENKIKKGYLKKRGTNKFVGYEIDEYVTNYRKRIPQYDTLHNDSSFINQEVAIYDMSGPENDFYVYDKAVVNKLEYSLIERIKANIESIRRVYGKSFYLIRMDENMHRESVKGEKLKLHQFGKRLRSDGSKADVSLQGFQPDFLLLLENENVYFQIFIEPKAIDGSRYPYELWKEDLLLYINEFNSEIEFEDVSEHIEIRGLRFFTSNDGKQSIKQLREIVLGAQYEECMNEKKKIAAEYDTFKEWL